MNVLYYFYDDVKGRERMAGEGYEVLAMFMRYVFVLLGVLIVWRAYRWMRRDAKNYQRRMKRLPDAGLIGEIVDLNTGDHLPLPREGIIGSAASCDVRVKGNGIARKHALFSLAEGKGVLITPCGHHRITMEDVELTGPAYALHGTELWLGDVPLRVRLFAGLNVPHPAAYMREDAETEEYWDDLPGASGAYFEPAQEQNAYFDPLLPENELPAQTAYEQPEPPQEEEAEQGLPYQSPLPRRRGRGRYR